MIAPLNASQAHRVLPLLRQVQDLHVAEAPFFFHGEGTDAEYLAHFQRGFDEKSAFILADIEGDTLRGYLFGFPEEVPATSFTRSRREMVLDQICVDTAHRGRGIGRALVSAFEALTRDAGISHWRASHWAFNTASQALWAACEATPAVIVCRKDLSLDR
ncbi:N-acetyltransferase family protein [Roseobacteraceae bacterium S113]